MERFLLQMQWDAALLRAWDCDVKMNKLLQDFIDKRSIRIIELQKLKRVPRFAKQCHHPVRVFIASSLPLLSDRLWANHDRCELLMWMDEVRLETAVSKSSRTGELRSAIKETERMRLFSPHKGHRRRDWNVCK